MGQTIGELGLLGHSILDVIGKTVLTSGRGFGCQKSFTRLGLLVPWTVFHTREK